MASRLGADLWLCIALVCALPAARSGGGGDDNTAANELACPDGGCGVTPSSSTSSSTSAPPPPPDSAARNNSCWSEGGCGGGGGGGCPDDSYLGGAGCRCLPLACPVAEGGCKVVRPATGRPGKCCDLYECVTPVSNVTTSCVAAASDGGVEVRRAEGSAWFGAECSRCRCAGGLVLCDDADSDAPYDDGLCPDCPGTATTTSSPDQCCPLCLEGAVVVVAESAAAAGCVGAMGERVAVGGAWRLDDCTSCVCEPGGQRRCQAYMCEACPQPRYEPGQCCPTCNGSGAVVTLPSHCPSLLDCSLRCVHGFVRDHNGCFTCSCQQDECLLDCPLGFEQDTLGNKLCRCASARACPPLVGCRKRCPHGFRANRAGCPVCRCEMCKPLDRCTKRCAHGLNSDHRGCPLCKCTPFDHGLAVGTGNETVGTSCVSEAAEGSKGAVWRDDGETWFDGCRQCYCLAGREMCSLLGCPPVPCPDPLYNSSKDCCPYCPGDTAAAAGASQASVCQAGADGGVLVEGETWPVGGESGCVRCVCRGGRALCRAASCPPAPCAEPLAPPPGQCCPVCPPDQLDNHTLSVSCASHEGQAMWREGDCVSCACREDGRPACFTELCRQQAACSNPLRVKNQCCPICLDKVVTRGVCTAGNGSAVSVGGGWREDECTTCVCVAGGQTACTELVCSVACPNPVRQPGVCCHVCPESRPLGSNRELGYVVLVSAAACALALCVGFCAARRCRGIKRHRLKLHATDHSYHGCPPPQYTQYRYMPTYDSAQQPHGTTEKTALTPL